MLHEEWALHVASCLDMRTLTDPCPVLWQGLVLLRAFDGACKRALSGQSHFQQGFAASFACCEAHMLMVNTEEMAHRDRHTSLQ